MQFVVKRIFIIDSKLETFQIKRKAANKKVEKKKDFVPKWMGDRVFKGIYTNWRTGWISSIDPSITSYTHNASNTGSLIAHSLPVNINKVLHLPPERSDLLQHRIICLLYMTLIWYVHCISTLWRNAPSYQITICIHFHHFSKSDETEYTFPIAFKWQTIFLRGKISFIFFLSRIRSFLWRKEIVMKRNCVLRNAQFKSYHFSWTTDQKKEY